MPESLPQHPPTEDRASLTGPDYKTGLSEAAKLYQSSLDLKHKIWTLFFAVSGGLATYYWASQYYAKGQLGFDQLIGVRLLGVISCIFSALAIYRAQQFVDHFETRVAEYSRALGLANFAERDRLEASAELPRGAVRAVNAWFIWIEIVVMGAAAIGWLAIGWRVTATGSP